MKSSCSDEYISLRKVNSVINRKNTAHLLLRMLHRSAVPAISNLLLWLLRRPAAPLPPLPFLLLRLPRPLRRATGLQTLETRMTPRHLVFNLYFGTSHHFLTLRGGM